MKTQVDIAHLRRAIQFRLIKDDLDLRRAARQIGVGFATLSRLANSTKGCTLETFVSVCLWLRCSPLEFLPKSLSPVEAEQVRSPLERFACLIGQDEALDEQGRRLLFETYQVLTAKGRRASKPGKSR
jgi:DNA-binding Xre family transcriptional regulator